MPWQDFVIMISNILLSYALIPQVIKGFKDKRRNISIQTGVISVIGLSFIAYSFFSLGLLFSGWTLATTATLWAVLLYQTLIYKK